MANPIQLKIDFFNEESEEKLTKAIALCVGKIDTLFDNYENQIAMLVNQYSITNVSKNPMIQNVLDSFRKTNANNIYATIQNSLTDVWSLANKKNDQIVSSIFDVNSAQFPREIRKKYFQKNEKALEQFIKRKDNGLGLSDRVWNLTDYQDKIDTALQIGIGNGMSADNLSDYMLEFLKNPRGTIVKVDDKGIAQEIPAEKQKGVYSDPKANAMRLARTENNMAYRNADFQRWQQFDFVVGFEVHLSKNHTTKMGNKIIDLFDICDELKGKYPKDFKFSGWHPNCRCYMTSILKTQEEMDENNRAILEGGNPLVGSKNTITRVPDAFSKWIKDNEEKINNSKNPPYFIKDNPKYTGIGKSKKEIILENAKIRHDARTSQQIEDIKKRWEERKKINQHNQMIERVKERQANRTPEQIAKIQNAWNERKADIKFANKIGNYFSNTEFGNYKVIGNDILDKVSKGQYKLASDKASFYIKNFKKDILDFEKDNKYISDTKKWLKQFSEVELMEANNAIGKKIDFFNSLPLEKQKTKLAFEIDFVEKTKKYPTWEIAKKAYEKELSDVENAIVKNQYTNKLYNDYYELEKHKATKDLVYQAKIELYSTNFDENKINDIFAKLQIEKDKLDFANFKKDKLKSLKSDYAILKDFDTSNISNVSEYKDAIKDIYKNINALSKIKDFNDYKNQTSLIENSINDIFVKYNVKPVFDITEENLKNAIKFTNLNDADSYLRPKTEKLWANATKAEKEAVTAYTAGSGHMNRPLRGYKGNWSNFVGIGKVDLDYEHGKKHIEDATNLISKSKLEKDMWLVRGTNAHVLKDTTGVDYNDLKNLTQKEIEKLLVGKEYADLGFHSCGTAYSTGFNGDIKYEIFCPKGTQALYCEPFSVFNGDNLGVKNIWDGKSKYPLNYEFETLLQRGTKFRIIGAEFSGYTLNLKVAVVEQI